MNNIFKHLISKDSPYWFLYYIINNSLLRRFLDDKAYLTLQYRCICQKTINWERPQTFNEKLQWLKLNYRKELSTILVDKYRVKKYIADLIGEEYVIPLLGKWHNPEDIDFNQLPEQFVIKCNHNCGGMCICKDKSQLDITKIKKELKKSLKEDYYLLGREWPYKNVKRCVFAEKYVVDESDSELKDYKFFCFNGEPDFFKIDFDRFVNHKANYYDLDWNILPFEEKVCPPMPNKHIPKPTNFEKMVELARILAKGWPFVRVDFYNVNGKIYFGEMTFFPASGLGVFKPEEADLMIGEKLLLPLQNI